jgi:hypothetical protein
MPPSRARTILGEVSYKISEGNRVLDNKANMKELIQRAEEFTRLCKGVDYPAILAHNAEAVAALQDVLIVLKKALPRNNEDLNDYAQAQSGPRKRVNKTESDPEKAALLERRRHFVEAFSQAGLGNRLGKIYSSLDERRLLAFREAPHQQGLPKFDMVIGPDFSPVNGLHGIFIGAQEVMSCVLPSPSESHQWQVRERHRFSNNLQVVDLVSMLSAGFPINS